MKMKILDCALLALLSGSASLAWAQAPSAPSALSASTTRPDAARPAATPAPECTASGCSSEAGLLFQLQTRGKREPVTRDTNDKSGSRALQPDRRVTVEVDEPARAAAPPDAPPGRAVASGKFSVQLPNGGVIWATEDPTLGLPELSVSGPALLAFENGRIKDPVQFFVRSNYPGFIQRYELTIYRATDADLTEPLATVPMPVAAVSRAKWDGALKTRQPLRAGDSLIYVLRAFGENGAVDETAPRVLQLVRADEAERGERILRDSGERSLGTAMTAQQAQTQRLIDNVFTSNGLRQQNISIYGSRSFAITPLPTDNLSCVFTNAASVADLQIVKTRSAASARTGGVIGFTLTATNVGPAAANNAVLRDVPGPGLDCANPSPAATCTANGGASCPGGTVPVSSLTGPSGIAIPLLPAGGSVVVTMQCTVTATGRP